VGGFFVGGDGGFGAVDFPEFEAGGVVLMLEEVEAGAAGFLGAVAGVFDGGGAEGFEVFGFDLNVDLEDEHDG
jgi:hypothetical protein